MTRCLPHYTHTYGTEHRVYGVVLARNSQMCTLIGHLISDMLNILRSLPMPSCSILSITVRISDIFVVTYTERVLNL
jgi:hypothetical protein